MLTFESDYVEGAHPKILEELMQTNMVQVSGYGNDPYTESAKTKIKKEFFLHLITTKCVTNINLMISNFSEVL